MKKLLFLMVVGFGATMAVKGHYVTVTQDNQVRVAGWTVPLPSSIQSSPIMGMLGMLVNMQASPQAGSTDTRYGAARPGLPNVTSGTSTYNANAPVTGPAQGSDALAAVAKALR